MPTQRHSFPELCFATLHHTALLAAIRPCCLSQCKHAVTAQPIWIHSLESVTFYSLDLFLRAHSRNTFWLSEQFIRIPRNERGLNPQAQHIQVAQDVQTLGSIQLPAWTPAAFQLLLFHLLYCAVLGVSPKNWERGHFFSQQLHQIKNTLSQLSPSCISSNEN